VRPPWERGHIRQLAWSVAVDKQDLGGEVGSLGATESLHEIERQVEERGCATRGDDVAVCQ